LKGRKAKTFWIAKSKSSAPSVKKIKGPGRSMSPFASRKASKTVIICGMVAVATV
jgi:hypothetical protein